MGLEVATTIEQLDITNPDPSDEVLEGDDHLRLIKTVFKLMLPGSSGNGLNAPITATEAEFNTLVGVSSAIQAQFDALTTALAAMTGQVPIGSIIPYNGLISAIPVNFQLCDGTNGTPNMANRFVYGTTLQGELLSTGGSADAVVVAHTHTLTSAGAHTHGSAAYKSFQSGSNGLIGGSTSLFAPLSSDGAHTHPVASSGVSGTGANIPPYVKLLFIQRMS